jgi:phage repressor protein C with HTH and peptisase S24 domain
MQEKTSQNANAVLIRLKEALSISTDKALADRLKVKANTLSSWKDRDTLDYPMLIAVCEEEGINMRWLFTGEGQPTLQAQMQAHSQAQLVVSEPGAVYEKRVVQPLAVTVNEEGKENIAFIDVKAAAGYPANIAEPSYFKRLPAYHLPGRHFNNGTFRTFVIEGDSMEDTLKHGEWVIGRYLENPADCKTGLAYVIITQDTIVFKRVVNRVKERGVLVLQSDNPAYRPYQVDIADVKEMWYISAAMIFDLSNKRLDLLKRVNELEAEMVAVQADIKKLKG